ncbi:MAG TPA: hypothetical protein VLC30_09375, partial [Pseudomonas sp.]|nr:hypothetical protein [Pseudomonas sp.]
MKLIFLLIWAVLSLLLLAASALYLWREPSVSSALSLFGVLYYAYCFLRLIFAAYRPWGLLGPSRVGDWLCLLLLPLTLLPLHTAYEIWQAEHYSPEPYTRRHRLSITLGQHALSWLQDLVGYPGPMLVLAVFG